MNRHSLFIFGMVALIALVLAAAFGADRIATGVARDAAAGGERAAPLPLERPARPGETRMRDAALASEGVRS